MTLEPPVVLAIDPGTRESGWVAMSADEVPVALGIDPNEHLLGILRDGSWGPPEALVILERFESYGMPLGETSFATIEWCGRFIEAVSVTGHPFEYMARREAVSHLCGDHRAGDSGVTAALVDRYGGDRSIAKGTKHDPGPLYGVRGHVWAALALAVSWFDDPELLWHPDPEVRKRRRAARRKRRR